jgi:hypothetical protein
MNIFRSLTICASLLAAPAIVHAAPPAEIAKNNPAIGAVADSRPNEAQTLIEELQARLHSEEEDFDGQNMYEAPLSDEDKAMLQWNPLLMEVYEHNPHGMAELLERIRNAAK